jgi:hypothetical protein
MSISSQEEKKKDVLLTYKTNVFQEESLHKTETTSKHVPLVPISFLPEEYEMDDVDQKVVEMKHAPIEIAYATKHTPIRTKNIDKFSHEMSSNTEDENVPKRQKRSISSSKQLTPEQFQMNMNKMKIIKDYEWQIKNANIETIVHELKLRMFSHREDWLWRHIIFMEQYEANLDKIKIFMNKFQQWSLDWGKNNNGNVMDAPWIDLVGELTLIITAYNLHFKEINKVFLNEDPDTFIDQLEKLNEWLDMKRGIQMLRNPEFETLMHNYEVNEQNVMFNYYSRKPIFTLFKTYVEFFENPNNQEMIETYETDDIEQMESKMMDAFNELVSYTDHLYLLMEFVPETLNESFFSMARDFVRHNRLKKYIQTNFIPKLKRWTFSYTQKETVLSNQGMFKTSDEIDQAKGDGDAKADSISIEGLSTLRQKVEQHFQNYRDNKLRRRVDRLKASLAPPPTLPTPQPSLPEVSTEETSLPKEKTKFVGKQPEQHEKPAEDTSSTQTPKEGKQPEHSIQDTSEPNESNEEKPKSPKQPDEPIQNENESATEKPQSPVPSILSSSPPSSPELNIDLPDEENNVEQEESPKINIDEQLSSDKSQKNIDEEERPLIEKRTVPMWLKEEEFLVPIKISKKTKKKFSTESTIFKIFEKDEEDDTMTLIKMLIKEQEKSNQDYIQNIKTNRTREDNSAYDLLIQFYETNFNEKPPKIGNSLIKLDRTKPGQYHTKILADGIFVISSSWLEFDIGMSHELQVLTGFTPYEILSEERFKRRMTIRSLLEAIQRESYMYDQIANYLNMPTTTVAQMLNAQVKTFDARLVYIFKQKFYKRLDMSNMADPLTRLYLHFLWDMMGIKTSKGVWKTLYSVFYLLQLKFDEVFFQDEIREYLMQYHHQDPFFNTVSSNENNRFYLLNGIDVITYFLHVLSNELLLGASLISKVPPLLTPFNHFWIYSSIVKPEIVNKVKTRLLATATTSALPGQLAEIVFNFPHYKPLASNVIDEITILIATSQGDPIPFIDGPLTIQLHIKKSNALQ